MSQLQQEHLNAYLSQLGLKHFTDIKTFTADHLSQIVKAHLARYAYNNLQVQVNLGTAAQLPSLSADGLADKILGRHQGGYCFEHNEFLYLVLDSLGLDVRRIMGRVLYGRDVDVPKTHQVTCVSLDGQDYIVDVGFAAYTPNIAMPIAQERPKILPPFWIEPIAGGEYGVYQNKDNGGFIFYSFDLGRYSHADTVQANFYVSSYADSKFVKELVCSRIGTTETHLLHNNKYSKIQATERHDEEVSSFEQFTHIITDLLGIKNYSQDQLQPVYDRFVHGKSVT